MAGTAKRFRDKIRHGLVLLALQDRLESIGVNIRPFYWMKEGISVDTLPEFEDDSGEYSFEFFGDEEMGAIGVTEERGDNVETYHEWLREGSKCFGVKHRGNIVAYNWAAFGEVPHEWANGYHLKDNESYLFHMYTMKQYRGKKMAPYLRTASYRALKEMGRDTFYSLTSAFNKPAIKFKRKLDARPLKLGLYIQLFKRFSWHWTLKEYKD